MKKIVFIAAILSYSLCVKAIDLPSYDNGDDTTKTVTLETVTVTAQQREQKLQDVPVAVTAIGSKFLENTQTTSLEQLAVFVPGLNVTIQTPHRPSLSIRGLTSDEVSPTAQPRVSVYYNNVPTSRASMALAELYDMERIEVLKGPQGTLFGRGSQIGVIHFISQKPVADFEGYISAKAGNYARKEIEGAINIPVMDNKLMFRAAGLYSYHDGYVTNLSGGKLNGKNTFGGRFSAAWLPTDNFNINLTVSYQKDDNPGTAFMSKRYPNAKGEYDIFKYEASLDEGKDWFNRRDVFGTSLNMKYYFDNGNYLTSITSLYNNTVDHRWDGDGSVAPAIDMKEMDDARQFTQELRYNFSLNDKLEGFAGLSYWQEKAKQSYWFGPNEQYMAYLIFSMPEYMVNPDGSIGYPMPTLPSDPMLGPLGGMPLPTNHEELSLDKATNKATDAFVDLTWKITSSLSFTAGLRATYENFFTEHKTDAGVVPSMLGNLLGTAPNFFFAPGQAEMTKDFMSVTYRTNLKYALNETSSLYAGYARGRRPNVLQFNSAGQGETMNAENVHSFDIGYKLIGYQRYQFDVDLFYQLYNNFQSSKWDGANYLVADAGKATSYGAELTVKYAVAKYLELFGNYAYIHARFDDKDSDGNTQEYAGNTFRLTPENSFALGVHLKASLSDKFQALFTPAYSWKSHIWFEDSNDKQPENPDLARLEQDAYGLLNVNLALKYMPTNLTLSLFAHNLLGEKYLIGAGNTGMMFGVPTYVPGIPRMIGAGLKYIF
ncbi:MAG: TonB-dependent receptor [Dysgonamonadaceae bacterium]|jgi:outer membrane receptor protein involved in Fe transport|nr:TonB-dependent receptor [Dysgonamonadaceae bacterium]